MNYKELKERHQTEVNAFPLGAAFSNKQFAEMMAKWGFGENETDKIYSIGAGCYIRRADSPVFRGMFNRHEQERQQAMDADKTGGGYIYQMFACELADHEYGYTYDFGQTFDALGLTFEQVYNDKRLRRGLNKALKQYGGKRI